MRRWGRMAIACTALLLLGCGGRESSLPELAVLPEGEIVWEGWTPALLVAENDTMRCEVHYRGGISSGFPKPSLALRFDRRRALLDLPEDKDFVLNASYIDKTFLRHKMCYDLFRAMQPERNRAPLCTYAMLRRASDELGLYVVMQKLDASTLGVGKADSTSVIFKDPPLFYTSRITPQDSDNYYQQTFPKKRKDDRTAQIEALRSFVFESDDSTLRAQVAEVVDLDNVVDWHLLLLLSNNSDGLLKNFYLYKADDRTPWRVAPWDYDHSLGRDGDNAYNMLTDTVDCSRNELLRRLWQWDAYRQRLCNRWWQLRQQGTISTMALCGWIDTQARDLRRAVKANERRWPVDGPHYKDAGDFDHEVEVMKQFVRLNVERLDRMLDAQQVAASSVEARESL